MKKITRYQACLDCQKVYSERTMTKCLRHQINPNMKNQKQMFKNYKKWKRERNDK